ncbi:hypothetical protein KDJ21_017230 [Metabacillus litoralis]|uniref:hypothetical protein n=1 Tax=Metabacillus litoralis TaxID=152268 RepID=UPI001E3E1431|nr:hypothetical protein [Metabacillus litoralis]UHA58571.1 hypothetical protein KDJ21_017230 [Metabacillus litoralis]
MKQINVLIGVLLFSILNPIKSVLAHNGIDEQNSTKTIFDQWNIILFGALVIFLVAYIYLFKKNKTFLKSLAFSFQLYSFFI